MEVCGAQGHASGKNQGPTALLGGSAYLHASGRGASQDELGGRSWETTGLLNCSSEVP